MSAAACHRRVVRKVRAVRLLRVLLVAAVLLVAGAVPAGAHVGGVSGASDFRTELVDGGDDCLTWRVLGDGSVSLRSDCAGPVVVLGYEDEPYLELSAAGARENRASPATYLNRDARATTAVPPGANPDAEPDWVVVGDEPEHRWHDHRIHWMSTARPVLPGDGPGQVGEWTIPVRLSDGSDAGREVAATGTLWYRAPRPEPVPLAVAALAVAVVAASVLASGARRRWWPVPALLAVTAAGTVAMAAEELVRAGREGRLGVPAVAVAVVVLGVVAGALWRSVAGDETAGYAAMAAGAALCWGFGWVDRAYLTAAYLPGPVPDPALRLLVSLQLLAPIAPVGAVLARRRGRPGKAARSGATSLPAVLAVAVAVGVTVLGRAEPAAAHAGLADTVPAAGAVLERPPARIDLRFTEPVDPVPGGIRLVRSDGTDVEASVGRIDGDAATVALTPGQPLDDGVHVVAWRVTSADSHPIRGAFTFTVGSGETGSDGSGDDRSITSLVERLLADDGDVPGAAALLAVGRSLSFAGALLCIGWAAFGRLRLTASVPVGAVAVAGAVGAAGTAVMVAVQAVVLQGGWGAAFDPGGWVDVIATRSGSWWAARLLLLASLAAGAAVLRRRPTGPVGAPATSATSFASPAVAVVVAVVTAFGGHAATGRWPIVGVGATVAHLLAIGVWSAGLLSLVGPATLRGPGGDRAELARRFSPVALVAVGVAALSGLVNGARQVGSPDLLWSTGYGRALSVKVALVVAVVALAAVSRRTTRRDPTDARLVRSVAAEVVLLVVVLAVTTVLVAARPAIAERATVGEASAVVGERVAQVVLDPARTGGAALHVYLTSPRGALDRAEDITVSATLAEQDIGPLSLPVFPAGPNHVTNPSVVLPVAGTWTIEVVARYGEFEEVRFRTTLAVRAAAGR